MGVYTPSLDYVHKSWIMNFRQGESQLNLVTNNMSMGAFERYLTKAELGFGFLRQMVMFENPKRHCVRRLSLIQKNVSCCEQSP